ncbi:unnamed protein product, partial [Allacma fusca]
MTHYVEEDVILISSDSEDENLGLPRVVDIWEVNRMKYGAKAKLSRKLRLLIQLLLRETPKSSLRKLLDFLNSTRQRQGGKLSQHKPEGETPEELVKRANYEYVVRVEKHLAKMEKAIEEYGQQDVDLSDEKNSSYLVRARVINRYMDNYKIICRKMGCNSFTGRPVEKRFTLKG